LERGSQVKRGAVSGDSLLVRDPKRASVEAGFACHLCAMLGERFRLCCGPPIYVGDVCRDWW
jgi:hypothetical protein